MANQNCTFFEAGQDKVVALRASAAATGPWMKLSDYTRVYAMLDQDLGGAAVEMGFEQATDATGTGAKALQSDRVWHRVAAKTSEAAWTFQKLETAVDVVDTAAMEGVDAGTAAADAQVAIEAMAERMDVDNGFHYVRVNLVSAGPANVDMIPCGAAYQSNTPTRPLS